MWGQVIEVGILCESNSQYRDSAIGNNERKKHLKPCSIFYSCQGGGGIDNNMVMKLRINYITI